MSRVPEMTDIRSSNIEAVGYDRGELHVRFKGGGHYVYFDVPSDVHRALMRADSTGSHFHEHVKEKFTYRKLK